jgi:hypothetical protein
MPGCRLYNENRNTSIRDYDIVKVIQRTRSFLGENGYEKGSIACLPRTRELSGGTGE